MFLALLCVTTCVHVIYVAVILCCRILLFRVNYWDKRSSCNRTFPQILNTLVWQPKFTVRNKYNIALRLHLFSGFLLLATMLLLTINVTLCTYNNEQCFFILMLFLHISSWERLSCQLCFYTTASSCFSQQHHTIVSYPQLNIGADW